MALRAGAPHPVGHDESTRPARFTTVLPVPLAFHVPTQTWGSVGTIDELVLITDDDKVEVKVDEE